MPLFHLLILAALGLALLTVIANLATFGGLRDGRAFGADAPLVSILVPARNEARNIGACVRSLLAQDYPNYELTVLDDHSTDETAEIARGLGLGAEPARRLMAGAPLPAGWVGKNWACHQLAAQAVGEFLFFTDADTEHAPGTVAAAVTHALATRASLLSAWPRLVTKTWSERLIIPMIVLLGMALYPHWLLTLLQKTGLGARLPAEARRALGAANGQFMFFTRAAYARIGGHEALRDHLVEDVALGRAVAARMDEGLRLINCEAMRFSSCRMYRSFGEVWEGFTKNIRPAFERSLAGFLALGTVSVCCFLLPFLLLASGDFHRSVLAEVALIYLLRLLLTLRFRTSWLSLVLHPFGQALALAIGLNSWRLSATTGVRWKGRVYVPARPGK